MITKEEFLEKYNISEELSSFFYRLKQSEEEYLKSRESCGSISGEKKISDKSEEKKRRSKKKLSNVLKTNTPYDCLMSILDE